MLDKAGLDKASSDAGDALWAVFNELGMPASLKEVGVGRDKFDTIARNSLKDPRCVVNPVPLKEEAQVLEVLEMVVGYARLECPLVRVSEGANVRIELELIAIAVMLFEDDELRIRL